MYLQFTYSHVYSLFRSISAWVFAGAESRARLTRLGLVSPCPAAFVLCESATAEPALLGSFLDYIFGFLFRGDQLHITETMAEVADSGPVEPQARHVVYCGGEYPVAPWWAVDSTVRGPGPG